MSKTLLLEKSFFHVQNILYFYLLRHFLTPFTGIMPIGSVFPNYGGDRFENVMLHCYDSATIIIMKERSSMINNAQQTNSSIIELPEYSIKVGIATTLEEKREIYHFRYQTYVEEMSKHLEDTDYANELVYDELDEWTVLLSAKIGSKLIATARINIGTLTDFPGELKELMSLYTFQNYNTETIDHKLAFASKLMVAPAHRSSPVLYLLVAKCYELSVLNQVQFAFTGCNLHLLRLYEQIGFHRYSRSFVCPGYGLLTPTVMAINDVQHLRAIRSPLYRIARKRGEVNIQAVEWFHTKFTNHSQFINSQIVTEEELWSVLCNRLTCPPTEAIAVLRELSIREAKKFLHCCGILVQCHLGDLITTQGDVSYSYDILISGRLKSLTFLHPVKEYALPGQNFGANGLTEHTKHIEDIIATDASEILVLSGMAFQKFFHSHPDIAHKVVQSIIHITKNNYSNLK